MKLRSLGFLAAGAALLAFTTPAAATAYTVTYTGKVSSGYDQSGIFGLGAGADLYNQDFIETFQVDTSTPGAGVTTAADSITLEGYGAANPVLGSVTINGVTQYFGNDHGNDFRADTSLNPGCDSACAQGEFGESAYNMSVASDAHVLERYYSYAVALGRSPTYHPVLAIVPPSYGPADGVVLSGSLYINHYIYDRDLDMQVLNDITRASFAPTSMTVSGAPEPGVWAMLLLGFGGLGGLLRRRRLIAA